ncbi:MAG: hypothetical protein Q9168_004628 [Polycauliona sp. 1 TL-2023]
MNLRWAVLSILCVHSTRALFLPSLAEDGSPQPLQPRQNPLSSACYDYTTAPSGNCIGQYLITWPLTAAAKGCFPGETWSSCFIRWHSGAGVLCTELDQQVTNQLDTSCGAIKDLPSILNSSVNAQLDIFYAPYVIATMQNVYTLLDKLANVSIDLDQNDPVLVKLRTNPMNLTNPGDVDPGNYATALTQGLAYLAYQQFENSTRRIGHYPISDDVYNIAYNFAIVGMQSSPAVIDVMWPIETDINTPTSTSLTGPFAAGLANLFTNLQRFVAFTSKGTFTYNVTDPDHLSFGTGLTLAASTLYTTTRLLFNGFIIVPDPNPYNSSQLIPPGGDPTQCFDLVDNDFLYGIICDALDRSPFGARFWSPSTNRLYNFGVNITLAQGIQTLQAGTTNAKQVLLDIWHEGYADLSLMFDGGYTCQVNNNFGQLLRVSTSGRMDFNCFSSVPMQIPDALRAPLIGGATSGGSTSSTSGGTTTTTYGRKTYSKAKKSVHIRDNKGFPAS